MIFKNTVVTSFINTSAIDVVREMATAKTYVKGLAVIIDNNNVVLGVFNDGDIIRLIGEGKSLDVPISNVMTDNPIVVNQDLSNSQIIEIVQAQLYNRGKKPNSLRDVIIVDNDNKLINVLNYVDLLTSNVEVKKKVAVYGQGFVGITLAAALANIGHQVYGIDVQEDLVKRLKNNDIHVFEPRLNDAVAATQKSGNLVFGSALVHEDVRYHIVAVGTPVDNDGNANLSALKQVIETIGKRLNRGDVVMLRSTVPVGTTRNFVMPILEQISLLKAGLDFHLAFTPERTAEGKAMEELRSLPQIVGGYSSLCAKKAMELWSSLTDSVVRVESLEASELVKLINNSFRDLSFAFSNSVALLCNKYNLNAFKLIHAANEGYPRNPVPLPSPGVGGYCLTKDPYLFASINSNLGHAVLAKAGRKVNDEALYHVIQQVEKYLNFSKQSIINTKVLVVGMAFKGWPETNDLRGSSGVFVATELQNMGAQVSVWDAVVDTYSMEMLNLKVAKYPDEVTSSDLILIMNNHPDNIPEGFMSYLQQGKKLIFDGWSLLDPKSIENIKDVTYSTMGYMSKFDSH